MHWHLSMRSRNSKVGPIPVSTASDDTCPAVCPFKGDNGSYAAAGREVVHWRMVSSGKRGGTWEAFLE